MNSSKIRFVRTMAGAAALAGLLCASTPFAAFAATPLTVTLTSTAPTQPSSTAQNPIPVTATFSEAVTGFDAGDLQVANGSVVNFASSSATVYTFGIVPASPSGSVSVDLSGSAVNAMASGEPNQASSELQFIYDPNAADASSTASTTPSGTAYLALSAYSGPAGTAFNALGTNFASSEQVSLGFAGATTTVSADASGNFTAPLQVPAVFTTGPAGVTAMGQTSNLVAMNSFYVDAASSSATSTATSTPSMATSTGPSLMITSGPADGSFTNQQIVTFAFTTDTGATTVCTFGASFGCASPVTLGATSTPLGDGPYTFTVVATDASSTASTTVSRSFTVDTVAPVIAQVAGVPGGDDQATESLTFTSSKAGTLFMGGGCGTAATSTVMGTSTVTLNALGAGTYNCTLMVTDTAGNGSNTLALSPFTITSSAPTTPAPSSGGGGGGGGGIVSGPLSIGYVNTNPTPNAPQTTTPPAVPGTGQVLGASTYNFTTGLSFGMSGTAVTELQKILIADSFLNIPSPTGYFGALTRAAVRAFQKQHGLPQVGVVGPLTRGILNQGL